MITNVTLLQKNLYINPFQWNFFSVYHFKMLTQHSVTCKIAAFELGYVDVRVAFDRRFSQDVNAFTSWYDKRIIGIFTYCISVQISISKIFLSYKIF